MQSSLTVYKHIQTLVFCPTLWAGSLKTSLLHLCSTWTTYLKYVYISFFLLLFIWPVLLCHCF